ncbi:MAG: guanylate kinase [Lachnospiraceae bacterium]|nr:guanylate kinase [Lachnospiraceae bacterium]
MGKIFCLMGKSSCGKDTIYKHLLDKMDLKRVVLYTTRPIREQEQDGVEYHFCTVEEAKALEKAGKIIEKRVYQTIHGPWEYFTVDDGSIDLSKWDYLMIGTLEAYESLCNYYTKEAIVPIYIEVEDGVRLARALERERQQQTPKYEEMCRRFLGDAKDFSEKRLEECGITKIFENQKLEETVTQVMDYITEVRSQS